MKMKKSIFYLLMISLCVAGCTDEDQRCATCSFTGFDQFEACELENGNASVLGEDVGMDFDEYIRELNCSE